MRATRKYDETNTAERIAIDTPALMQTLSCGRATATQIGEAAGAKITIGRRVLWNTAKIREYLSRAER